MDRMEVIRARKDAHLRHFRRLGRERDYRRETGLLLCEGDKILREALHWGLRPEELLYRAETAPAEPLPGAACFAAPGEIFAYASPLENSPGPLFTLRRSALPEPLPASGEPPRRVLVLEELQDPGNMGTVLRTAAALGAELTVLLGNCADPCQPKAVRASMGAVFRQRVLETDLDSLTALLADWELPLYGAALTEDAVELSAAALRRGAVAVGNEGHGLSETLLARCQGTVRIPMTPGSESLNAAAAAAILLWEMVRSEA